MSKIVKIDGKEYEVKSYKYFNTLIHDGREVDDKSLFYCDCKGVMPFEHVSIIFKEDIEFDDKKHKIELPKNNCSIKFEASLYNCGNRYYALKIIGDTYLE